MKIKWTKFEQDAFYEINRILTRNTLLNYPYFNEIFKIHTDARNLQLGLVISQKGKLITFYNRKITDAHKSYTVTDSICQLLLRL